MAALILTGFFTVTNEAQGSTVDLVLGGEGATAWSIANIKPGDSGVKPVQLRNTGDAAGLVTIWISDIDETDYGGDGGALDDYLLFGLSCSRLSSGVTLPTRIRELPQNASEASRLLISPLYGGETIALAWDWRFPETGQAQNNAQGDHLSFAINYALEEIPPAESGGPGDDAGGDAGVALIGECSEGDISTTGRITASGAVVQSFVVFSPDSRLSLSLDQGVVALDERGSPFGCIGIHLMERPLPPAEGAELIGAMYRVIPEGAVFNPAATLGYRYSPGDLPPGIDEKGLFIAYYDSSAGRWVKAESTVDTAANTIAAKISRFYNLAVFGYRVAAPQPAAFRVESLSISPAVAGVGEAVNIRVLVTNSGGQPGS